MNVLVYGGTGTQFAPLVAELLGRGHRPRVLTRDRRKVPALLEAGSEVAVGDLLDRVSLERANAGIDAVAFMVPAFRGGSIDAAEYAQRAVDAAMSAGVSLIVWNTGGRFPAPADTRKADIETRAVWSVLKSGGVPFITVAPTTYMENMLGPWTLRGIRESSRIDYPVLESRQMGWIASRDVCALVATALERPEFAGRIFSVSGTEAVTGAQLASTFSEVLGRRFTYRTLTPGEMKSALETVFGEGSGDEVAEEYALDQADPCPPAKFHDMKQVLRDLPVRMTSLREWVKANAPSFFRTA